MHRTVFHPTKEIRISDTTTPHPAEKSPPVLARSPYVSVAPKMSTMITHRQKNIAVFDYFREYFLDGPDSPIYLTCEYCAILDMIDLLSLPDVDLLEYIPTPRPNTQPEPPQTLQLG